MINLNELFKMPLIFILPYLNIKKYGRNKVF